MLSQRNDDGKLTYEISSDLDLVVESDSYTKLTSNAGQQEILIDLEEIDTMIVALKNARTRMYKRMV